MAGYLEELSRYGYGGMGAGMGNGMGWAAQLGNYDPQQAYAQQPQQQPISAPAMPQSQSQAPNSYFPPVPQSKNGTNGLGGTGVGFNLNTASTLLGGLQTIGNIWQAWQANKLAKEQFNFQKEITTTNLNNQVQSYNTNLSDRAFSRYHTQNMSPEDAQRYIEANKLNKKT